LSFIPTVAPWFSGIISILNAPLGKSMRSSEVTELYEEKYGAEKLCIVGKGVPDVREVEGKHGWRMGGVQVHSSGKRVVVVVSDPHREGGNQAGLSPVRREHWITSSKGQRHNVCRCVTTVS